MSEQRIEAKLPDYGTRTDEITIYAGPCSVESEEQFFEVAECISDLGLTWIRGGAYKPRTNPHSFQGLGEEALKIMKAGGEKYGLKTLTEVMDSEHCELVHSYVDGLQVGARNFQNFSLLKNIGKVTKDSHKMVLFKRGFAGTIAEWLAATDYITMEGNDNVVLCERGLRTFETATRFTLDISAVPVIHKQSLLPICVDVSHPAGVRDLVPSLARAAVAVGADSIMIEVHPNPPAALSDGPQQLTPAQFRVLVEELREIAAVFGKKIVSRSRSVLPNVTKADRETGPPFFVCGIEHPLAMLCTLGADRAHAARKRYNHQSRLARFELATAREHHVRKPYARRHHHAQRPPASGRRMHRRPAFGLGWCWIRQNARAHVPHRAHPGGFERGAMGDLGHHVHQQGGR